jgi:hypothetical protein
LHHLIISSSNHLKILFLKQRENTALANLTYGRERTAIRGGIQQHIRQKAQKVITKITIEFKTTLIKP